MKGCDTGPVDETPRHSVTVKAFLLVRTVVTNAPFAFSLATLSDLVGTACDRNRIAPTLPEY
jgi:hypothetical protein